MLCLLEEGHSCLILQRWLGCGGLFLALFSVDAALGVNSTQNSTSAFSGRGWFISLLHPLGGGSRERVNLLLRGGNPMKHLCQSCSVLSA